MTLLPSGKVLVAGGVNNGNVIGTAELYDPATGTWTPTGSLSSPRGEHSATLLPNGKVLVASGYGTVSALTESAEIYDPMSGIWTPTGSLITARAYPSATLLAGGKVLVAGGSDAAGTALPQAELYDPSIGTWGVTGNLNVPRDTFPATLLPNGKVLATGGYNTSALASTELYDPTSGTWTLAGNLTTARSGPSATLLTNGKVLAAGGGQMQAGDVGTAELYDPAVGSWSATANLLSAREYHTATLLLNGRVLLAGGIITSGTVSAEVYDVGLGFLRPTWQPAITSVTSPLANRGRLILTGSRFQGISQASSGDAQDSSANYPLVQLRTVDSGQSVFVPVDESTAWSDTAFSSAALAGFPAGPAVVTVITNGIPSDAKYIIVAPAPGLKIVAITRLAAGHVMLQCLGVPNQVNNLQVSPDLSPGSFMSVVPPPPAADGTGNFSYDDAGAVGLTKRFYRLSSP